MQFNATFERQCPKLGNRFRKFHQRRSKEEMASCIRRNNLETNTTFCSSLTLHTKCSQLADIISELSFNRFKSFKLIWDKILFH